MRFICFLLGLFAFYFNISYSQDIGTIYGTISDTSGYSVAFANVSVPGTKYGCTADRFGQYELKLPAGEYTVTISCVGYKNQSYSISVQGGIKKKYDFTITEIVEKMEEVKIISRYDQVGSIQRINTTTLSGLPSATGNIESIIKRLPGVASNNELSSQYSVRGGSFDENLIYVNDIEIYKPVLIRSGQQEGLSFVNPDLVGSIKFSAGGFDASYGDKMSSVLDINYRKPVENRGSFSASMLGCNLSFEGVAGKNNRFKHITGIRYKTTQYLLSSLDTKGEYKPVFTDAQTNLSYDLTEKFEVSFLGYFSNNSYQFMPTTREIEFGTFQLPLKANIYYEGQESDKYRNIMGAVSFNYHNNENLNLKVIASSYYNKEAETFDLLGEYNINQVERNGGSDSLIRIGVGGFLNHARNFLSYDIENVSHVGSFNSSIGKTRWGITYQMENVSDRLSEWEVIDSAGYIYPYSEKEINTLNPVYANNKISSFRFIGYLQHTFEIPISSEKFLLTIGLRSHYWSFNKENIFNPRLSLNYFPSWQKGLMLYTTIGKYSQPAFYKEMRNPEGVINKNIKAQKATNFILGSDYIFYAWAHPFKFTAEMYYKKMNNLIPYRIDNVRSIYAGENLAKGYAVGMDVKLNGEFVKGTQSWISISLLQTKEDIINDSYSLPSNPDSIIYPGYYPRPTDQLFNMNIFLQDYVPSYPDYKVFLSIHYGSALPVTVPINKRWDNVYKILPSYKRVDIGVSKVIKSQDKISKYKALNLFKEVTVSLEVFNLIGISNTVSFMWIKTFSDEEGIPAYFAVPNYLTSRRINFKISANF